MEIFLAFCLGYSFRCLILGVRILLDPAYLKKLNDLVESADKYGGKKFVAIIIFIFWIVIITGIGLSLRWYVS